MSDTPDRIFAGPDGQWNADPIEPCMTEYVIGAEYNSLRVDYRARIAELEEKYAKKARLLAESASIAERPTDERDAARKQTAELVEAVERYNRCPLDAHDRPESWDAIADIQAAAAKLKEQDDAQ